MINFTSFQNIEYYTSAKDQYLLIHKCACSSVRKAQLECFKKIENLEWPVNNKVRWTVLRDPYDRFISGLAYDITLNNSFNINIQDFVFNLFNKNLLNNIYEYINNNKRITGRLSHIIPQCTYLFQQPIDVYVDIKDLDLFLNINYNVDSIRENVGDKTSYCLVKEVVDNYKEKILDIYSMDYYVLDRIKSNNMYWNWNNGKII